MRSLLFAFALIAAQARAPPVRGVLAFLAQALLAFFYRRC